MYELPTSVAVNENEYEIRSDYRAALDICAALSDLDLDEQEKAAVILDIFYPAFAGHQRAMEDDKVIMPQEHYQEAIERCFWFIGGGAEKKNPTKQPQLVDWEQDFQYIVAPVNRVLGHEVRAEKYLHWWSFLSAYMEIGECLFAQIVRIREKKATGKPLDKSDKEWYRKNRHMVDMKTGYTEQENDILRQWGGV